MNKWSKYYLAIFLLLALNTNSVGQIRIGVFGSWNFNIPSSDLIEAGQDFSGTYTSNNNQVEIDIGGSSFFQTLFASYNWRVDVSKIDVAWNPNLILRVRRTGNGNNGSWFGSSITGGLNYQQITNSNQSFFTGFRSRNSIPIQYELSGVSLLLPAQTYQTTIIYTVTEL